MVDCPQYIDLMSDYLEDDLSNREKELWEKHFGDCPECKTFFESFQSSLEIVEYLQENACPINVKKRLEVIVVEAARERAAQTFD